MGARGRAGGPADLPAGHRRRRGDVRGRRADVGSSSTRGGCRTTGSSPSTGTARGGRLGRGLGRVRAPGVPRRGRALRLRRPARPRPGRRRRTCCGPWSGSTEAAGDLDDPVRHLPRQRGQRPAARAHSASGWSAAASGSPGWLGSGRTRCCSSAAAASSAERRAVRLRLRRPPSGASAARNPFPAGRGRPRLGPWQTPGRQQWIDAEVTAQVASVAGAARTASRQPRAAPARDKDAVLRAMADALDAATDGILAANAEDVERGRASGLAEALLDRLRLDAAAGRRRGPGAARRRRAARPGGRGGARLDPGQRPADPPGAGADGRRRHGLRGAAQRHRRRRRARPQERQRRGAARRFGRRRPPTAPWSTCCAARLEAHGLPADAVTLLDEGGRDAVRALMTRPRAGRPAHPARWRRPDPDRRRRESTVPVIETGVGNCHVYVDAAADLDKALRDRGQLQDPPAQRLQRGRVAARAPRRRRRLPAQGPGRARRGRGRPCTPTPDVAAVRRGGRRGLHGRRPTRTSATEYLALDMSVRVVRRPRRRDRAHPALRHAATPRRSSPRTGPPPGG